MKNAAYYIEMLGLQKHPEGGYYKEVYRSGESINQEYIPARFKGNRCFCTSIYYLLENNDFSAFHRIQSDEIWHFYKGQALAIHVISPDGIFNTYVLGENTELGENFQLIVPAQHWFAASLLYKNSFSLVGCTVAPGFDFEDFEMADRNYLLKNFPLHRNIIQKYCR